MTPLDGARYGDVYRDRIDGETVMVISNGHNVWQVLILVSANTSFGVDHPVGEIRWVIPITDWKRVDDVE
jgi:hypothetical protein